MGDFMIYEQIKYLASWSSVKLNKRLGQRGAEMVEYAIVLACIAAVAVIFYKANKRSDGGKGDATLNGILTDMWYLVSDKVDNLLGL